LRDLPEGQRPNANKGLSALSKYLGVHEQFQNQFRNLGFKWGGKSSDQIVIDRLTKVKGDPDRTFVWIRQVKAERPDLKEFMDLMAVSGLRLVEGVQCYNLIIKLAREDKLDSYYHEETRTLEHFRFKELFIRKGKKAFISFVPADLVQRISEETPLAHFGIVQRIQQNGLKVRFSEIREAHGTYLTKHLKAPEIDFLHGRVGSSVFMQNYFNPSMIGDLEQRTFTAIEEILSKIS